MQVRRGGGEHASDAQILAVHGPTAACHEIHTGVSESFDEVVSALAEARARRRTVWVGTWLTRSSCRSLVALADWLAGSSVAGWAIVWPRVMPSQGADARRMVPRLGIAVPHALRAVQRARQRGLPVALVGMPLCVLGPFAELRGGPREQGAHPLPCEGCAARDECPGLDPWYLQRFGAEELRPVSLVPREDRPQWVREGLAAAAGSLL